jgi:hypothetical protein
VGVAATGGVGVSVGVFADVGVNVSVDEAGGAAVSVEVLLGLRVGAAVCGIKVAVGRVVDEGTGTGVMDEKAVGLGCGEWVRVGGKVGGTRVLDVEAVAEVVRFGVGKLVEDGAGGSFSAVAWGRSAGVWVEMVCVSIGN